MRISFDLDDTLICYQPGVPQEKSLLAWLAREPLRLGAKALIRELQRSGHSVGIDNEAPVADVHILPDETDWAERVRGMIGLL